MYKAMLKDFLEIIQESVEKLGAGLDEPIEMTNGFLSYDFDEDGNTIVKRLEGTFISSPSWAGDEIEYIKVPEPCTRDDYMYICKQLMSIVFDYPIWESQQGYFVHEMERYIHNFCRKLKNEWKCFRSVHLHALPIRITSEDAKTEDGEFDGRTQGIYKPDSGMITIYNAVHDRGTKEEHEQTARHEILHYMLLKVGLNGLDDSPVFHFFCRVYDAGAYMALTEENQKIYDSLCSIYDDGKKGEIDEAFCKIIENNRAEKTDETAGNND